MPRRSRRRRNSEAEPGLEGQGACDLTASRPAGRGRAHCLRSALPAEAAIAKVFAKICQKQILFCKIFGRAGRTGTSRITSCQNFTLERPLAVAKTSKKRKKKKVKIFYHFGIQFFVIFDRFWRSQACFDVKIKFLEVFCTHTHTHTTQL